MGPKSISGSSPIPNRERISCARASASTAHCPARVGNSSSLSVLPGRSVDEHRQAEKKSAWRTSGRYRGPRQDAGRRRRYDAVRSQKRKRRNTVMTPPAELRTAVIMGASSGIGRATAEAFAKKGWSLVLAARSREDLEIVASHCRTLDEQVLVLPTDVGEIGRASSRERLCQYV